ncbi:MAG: ion channel [Ferruginibacter sp.]
MALLKKISGNKTVDNTGLNSSVTSKYARFVNKDGSANVVNKTSFFNRFSIYHYLINMPGWKFALLVFAFYTAINFLFAVVYYLFCVPYLQGIIKGTPLQTFEEAYFFSSQTLTTVGYGRISPVGIVANTIASLEALIGILTLAIITGLLYGRFVKPKAYIRFSKEALIAPFKEGRALMLRLAPIKNAKLSEVSIQVTCSLMLEENGKMVNRYFTLPLQFSTLNTLYLSWTVVHPINEESPFFNLAEKEMQDADLELIVFLKAFDEDFSNTVIARTSYTYDEIITGAKYVPVFYDSPEGKGTIVDLEKLDKWERVELG